MCQLYGVFEGSTIDDARYFLLINNRRSFDDKPHSGDVLYQHTLRTWHQNGNIWSRIFDSFYKEGDPTEWGWMVVGKKGVPAPRFIIKEVISRNL